MRAASLRYPIRDNRCQRPRSRSGKRCKGRNIEHIHFSSPILPGHKYLRRWLALVTSSALSASPKARVACRALRSRLIQAPVKLASRFQCRTPAAEAGVRSALLQKRRTRVCELLFLDSRPGSWLLIHRYKLYGLVYYWPDRGMSIPFFTYDTPIATGIINQRARK